MKTLLGMKCLKPGKELESVRGARSDRLRHEARERTAAQRCLAFFCYCGHTGTLGNIGGRHIRVAGEFAGNQFMDYLVRCLSGSKSLGGNIFGGKIINGYDFEALPCRYSPDCGVDLRCRLGQQLVKGIRF